MMKKLRIAALAISALALAHNTAMPMNRFDRVSTSGELNDSLGYHSSQQSLSPNSPRNDLANDLPMETKDMELVAQYPDDYLADPRTVNSLIGPTFYHTISGRTGSFPRYGKTVSTSELIRQYFTKKAERLEREAQAAREKALALDRLDREESRSPVQRSFTEEFENNMFNVE